jgi:hypothetical protein
MDNERRRGAPERDLNFFARRPFVVEVKSLRQCFALAALSAACGMPVARELNDDASSRAPSPRLPDSGTASDRGGAVAGGADGADASEPDVPDDARIVFAAQVDGGRQDLYSIRPDGTALLRLTETPDVDELSPSWSPDRSRIAHGWRDAAYGTKLMVLDSAGIATEVPLPAPTSHEILSHPYAASGRDRSQTSWSTDGSRIGFTVSVDNLDCGPSDDCRWSTNAFWSTLDGSVHDFVRTQNGTPASGSRAPLWDGTTIRFLFVCDHPACASPAWAFGSDHEPWDYSTASQDWDPMGDLDVANLRPQWVYTRFSSPPLVAISLPHDLHHSRVLARDAWMPRWSPTERHIAFLRDDGLYTMRPDGSAQVRIYAGAVHSLDW